MSDGPFHIVEPDRPEPGDTRHYFDPATQRCLKCGRGKAHVLAGGFHCDGLPDIAVADVPPVSKPA